MKKGIATYLLKRVTLDGIIEYNIARKYRRITLNFKELGLRSSLLDGIESLGFNEPTPIQEQAIPIILKGRDLIASAQTGTGKTAAFLLPIIEKISEQGSDNYIKALIIVPTRELAIQIDQMMEGISYFTNVSSIAVYGGNDGALFTREKEALTKGADVVISTPGRLKSHLNMEYVRVEKLQFLILDEADRMLDMGFYEDITKIISYLPEKRQNLLFSATMPHKIKELAKKVLDKPAEINIATSKPAEKIKQSAYVVYDKQKNNLAKYIIKEKDYKSIIVFCSTKLSVKSLAKALRNDKFSVEEFHSELDQKVRQQVLSDFKRKAFTTLVATDIMSRGIDIEDIDLVINFDIPNDGEDYVHRVGRTARAASDGEAITFIGERDQNKFSRIEQLIDKVLDKNKVPKFLGEAPEYKPKSYHSKGNKRNFRKKYRKKGKPQGAAGSNSKGMKAKR